jgi:hypothetical protein
MCRAMHCVAQKTLKNRPQGAFMPAIIDLLFGCTHRNYTFPQTHRCRATGRKNPMHVACLDCGAEALYDFLNMRPIWRSRQLMQGRPIREILESTQITDLQ